MELQPTEKDGEWVGEALEGVLPDELDGNVWVPEEPVDKEGVTANRFRLRGQNLIVLASVAPLQFKDSEERKANYHLTIFKEDEGKIKRPNTADINRVRETFICRPLKEGEQVYEGSVGDSRAHHIMMVFRWSPVILA